MPAAKLASTGRHTAWLPQHKPLGHGAEAPQAWPRAEAGSAPSMGVHTSSVHKSPARQSDTCAQVAPASP
jgi:hypothetical protein